MKGKGKQSNICIYASFVWSHKESRWENGTEWETNIKCINVDLRDTIALKCEVQPIYPLNKEAIFEFELNDKGTFNVWQMSI